MGIFGSTPYDRDFGESRLAVTFYNEDDKRWQMVATICRDDIFFEDVGRGGGFGEIHLDAGIPPTVRKFTEHVRTYIERTRCEPKPEPGIVMVDERSKGWMAGVIYHTKIIKSFDGKLPPMMVYAVKQVSAKAERYLLYFVHHHWNTDGKGTPGKISPDCLKQLKEEMKREWFEFERSDYMKRVDRVNKSNFQKDGVGRSLFHALLGKDPHGSRWTD